MIEKYLGKSISWGTLNDEDLVERFAVVLQDLKQDAEEDMKSRINNVLGRYLDAGEGDSWNSLAHDMMDILEELAPEGYYFGTLEGDGSDFGFWPDIVTVTAPAHWAPYLVNGDTTVFDYAPSDERECLALEAELGECIDAEEVGFVANPDYGLPGDCCEYTFISR